jgi:hypothetical protein
MNAINKKNQTYVNKAVSWLEKYNTLNAQRDQAEGEGDDKLFNKLDRKCENAYDRFLDYMAELPKREQRAIYKSELY